MLISQQEIISSNIDGNNETKYHWNEKVQFFLVKTLSTVLRQFSPRFCCITFVRTNCLVNAVVVTFLNVVVHPDLRRYLNDPGKRELGIKAAYQKQRQLSGSCLFLLFFFLLTVNSLNSRHYGYLKLESSSPRVHNSGSLFQANVCNLLFPGIQLLSVLSECSQSDGVDCKLLPSIDEIAF